MKLSDRCQRGNEEVDWINEGEGNSKEYICMTQGHRQQYDGGLREVGGGVVVLVKVGIGKE